jgi:hypothetical protein
MKRRTFLKVSLVTVAGLAGRLAFPWAAAAAARDVSFGGLLYRAGGGGKILTSADGSSWKLHTDLGDMYSITKLAGGSKLRLTVGYAGYSFGLVLAPNQRSWLTA